MTDYRVKIRKCPFWGNYETACLAVSVGKEYHEGDKLRAAVEWINTRFRRVIVDVADTLQRHNIMLKQGLSEPQAHEKANSLGEEWLERNKETLGIFTIPVRIDRWDNRLNHPEYKKTQEIFGKLYDENYIFHQAVDSDVSAFICRQEQTFNHNIWRNSVNYLLEEAAALTLFYRKNPCATIYPKGTLLCFKLLNQGEIDGAPNGFENNYHTQIHLISHAINDNSSSPYVGQVNQTLCREIFCR